MIESLWLTESEKLNDQMEKAISNANNESEEYCIGESFNLDFAKVFECEVLYRNSIVITVHNSLEYILDELCKMVAYTMGSKFKHSDLKNSGVFCSFKFYLK